MRRIALALALIAIPAIAVAATAPPHKMPAHKMVSHKAMGPSSIVKITMPGDLNYDYKSGPGQQVAQTYCLTCHSSGYVSMQPPMDAKNWLKTVTKMRKAYGTQMTDADATKIADYLGTAYGPTSH
jgi:cytochrome c5